MSSVFMNDEIENQTSTAFAREEFFSSGALSERALFSEFVSCIGTLGESYR
jgi:hypothetical protein